DEHVEAERASGADACAQFLVRHVGAAANGWIAGPRLPQERNDRDRGGAEPPSRGERVLRACAAVGMRRRGDHIETVETLGASGRGEEEERAGKGRGDEPATAARPHSGAISRRSASSVRSTSAGATPPSKTASMASTSALARSLMTGKPKMPPAPAR